MKGEAAARDLPSESPPEIVAAWNEYLVALRSALDYDSVEVWAWDRLKARLHEIDPPPKKKNRRRAA